MHSMAYQLIYLILPVLHHTGLNRTFPIINNNHNHRRNGFKTVNTFSDSHKYSNVTFCIIRIQSIRSHKNYKKSSKTASCVNGASRKSPASAKEEFMLYGPKNAKCCFLFGTGQVVCCAFIRAFSLKKAVCCCWKPGWWTG